MKNILCFIDNLNAGGAQRQICYLAKFLKENGFNVSLLTYHKSDFFSYYLSENNIDHIIINENTRIKKAYKLFRYLRTKNHDIVIAFLRNPVLISEIASIGMKKKWKLIVSERNSYIQNKFTSLFMRRIFHILADHLVVNSFTNKRLLNTNAPWLHNISVIYNYVDLDLFSPIKKIKGKKDEIILIGVGKYNLQKNILNLIEAINIVLKKDPDIKIKINWFGDNYDTTRRSSYLLKIHSKIKEYNLNQIFNIFPETKNILDEYRESSALILPSYYEGLPNVACEAMATGLPLLLSNVCDNPELVDNNENGFLFEPVSPNDIANKIILFSRLDEKEKIQMQKKSREKALSLFGQNKFISKYIELLAK